MLTIARVAMLRLANMRDHGRKRWLTAIVLVAVCTLTVSVATRYSLAPSTPNRTLAVQKHHSWRPELQRLLDNAETWVPPFVDTAIFQDPGCYPLAAKSDPVVPSVLLERNLYNRPPPLSFLSLS